MALPATLYRFKLEVSDIDRGYYGSIDTRVAMHPSESEPFLVTRVLAYALNHEEGLEFSAGLSTPDEPAIKRDGPNGRALTWIEIGNPSAKRLHKASKAAERVRVYTYKDVDNLKAEAAGEKIYQPERIEIFAFEPRFLESLIARIRRDNSWSVMHHDGELTVGIGDESYSTTVARQSLS